MSCKLQQLQGKNIQLIIVHTQSWNDRCVSIIWFAHEVKQQISRYLYLFIILKALKPKSGEVEIG